MSIINVNHISKRFGRTQAVNDLSFEVHPGGDLWAFGAKRRRENHYDPDNPGYLQTRFG